jgi:hypothetical protein
VQQGCAITSVHGLARSDSAQWQRRLSPMPTLPRQERVMTGPELLEEIASTWGVDESRTHWLEDGFDWSPGSYLVCVRAVPCPAQDPGKDEQWRLTVETELIRSPSIDDSTFEGGFASMAPYITPTYSLVYPPHEVWKKCLDRRPRTVSFFNSAYVKSETAPGLLKFFPQLALLQPIHAELLAEDVARQFEEAPAFVGSGRTLARDEVLGWALDLYRREGAKPSRWTNVTEFAAFARRYAESDSCFGFGDESGMALEMPFGDDSALIRLRSDQPHSYLGNGLRVTVVLPRVPSLPSTEAVLLNFLEASTWTDFPQLGCWHIVETEDGTEGVAHSCFFPNALYSDGIAGNLALWSLARAQWARETRWPDLEDKPMSDIIQKRLRSGVYP